MKALSKAKSMKTRAPGAFKKAEEDEAKISCGYSAEASKYVLVYWVSGTFFLMTMVAL